MGLFNRNKNNEEELLVILSEIRDNLNTNNADRLEERFDKVARIIENRCIDFKHENDEEIGVLHSTINRMDKDIENLKKLVKLQETTITHLEEISTKQNQQINTLTDILGKTLEIIKYDTTKKEPTNKKRQPRDYSKITNSKTLKNTYRNIKKNYNINMNNIKGLNSKGEFEKTNAGRKFKWNIQDIIQIKKLIPKIKEYPTVTSISKETKLSKATVSDLVYLIENGYFDKYLNEWEQMEADKMFGDWKPVIQNNPEKRQEAGIYGAK